jgi:hypothetical protein
MPRVQRSVSEANEACGIPISNRTLRASNGPRHAESRLARPARLTTRRAGNGSKIEEGVYV